MFGIALLIWAVYIFVNAPNAYQKDVAACSRLFPSKQFGDESARCIGRRSIENDGIVKWAIAAVPLGLVLVVLGHKDKSI